MQRTKTSSKRILRTDDASHCNLLINAKHIYICMLCFMQHMMVLDVAKCFSHYLLIPGQRSERLLEFGTAAVDKLQCNIITTGTGDWGCTMLHGQVTLLLMQMCFLVCRHSPALLSDMHAAGIMV